MPDYTLQYVYQLSDFDTSGGNITPPDERGAQAQGNPPFNIQLNPGASPLPITITDNDANFNEIGDNGQLLTSAVTIDGVTYAVGTKVIINYRIADDNGFEGYSISIGANNGGTNSTTAFVTNGPMTPGQTHTFTSESNIGRSSVPYSEFACFMTGTMIKADRGERPIYDLVAGDRVMTHDQGLQTVRWVGSRTIPTIGDIAPIAFEAGTLGCSRRLLVSPNHRMLIAGAMAELVCGDDELLISAKLLINDRTVRRVANGFATYVHIMFDYHEVIWANDCATESFYAGDQPIGTLNSEQAQEILAISPELRSGTKTPSLARAEARGYEAIVIAYSL